MLLRGDATEIRGLAVQLDTAHSNISTGARPIAQLGVAESAMPGLGMLEGQVTDRLLLLSEDAADLARRTRSAADIFDLLDQNLRQNFAG